VSTVEISHIVSPALRALVEYWRAKRGERRMPARRDIDPIDIPTLLPHLALIDVLPGAPRFRFRLVGTRITRSAGRDMTGRAADEEAYGEHLDGVLTVYGSSIERGGPTYGHNRAVYLQREEIILEWVNLPLSADGETVNMILLGVDDVTWPQGLLNPELRRKVAVGSRIFTLDVG
jgi:hypothetical protein